MTDARAPTSDRLRLVGPPGTNKVMAGELSRLARRALGQRLEPGIKEGAGALVYPFSVPLARLAVTYHRTAARVLWQLAASRARRLEPLYDELLADLRAHPGGWCRDGQAISVSVRNVGAFGAGERQVVGTVKNAVVDAAAARGIGLSVDPHAPDVSLLVRMHDDELSVSVDLAGPMNKRGYREEGGAAPLRETLAAALVMLARHDSRREPLLDPMAGSGTIAIEAAAMARGMPLWSGGRGPCLAALPAFDGGDGDDDPPPLFGDTMPRVVANELDRRAVTLARANIAAAGVGDSIRAVQGDFRDLTPARVAELAGTDAPGVILSNPPYGERLELDEAELLYEDLGDWLRGFVGWRAGFIVANREFEACLGMRPRIKKPLSARPLVGYFYLYDL